MTFDLEWQKHLYELNFTCVIAPKTGSHQAVDEEVGGSVDDQQSTGDVGRSLYHFFVKINLRRLAQQQYTYPHNEPRQLGRLKVIRLFLPLRVKGNDQESSQGHRTFVSCSRSKAMTRVKSSS